MALDAVSVVQAGVSLAARAGLGAVGIRAVATDLGVTPMALYSHVSSADALHDAVVDDLLSPLAPVGDSGEWDHRCRTWARDARQVFASAPGLAHHVLLEWVRLPQVLRSVDSLVELLEHEGPPEVDAVAAANAILMHVLMRAQAEGSVRAGGARRDLSTLRARKADLPNLWRHRDEYRFARMDQHFAYGLDAILSGIGAARRAT